jgi:outer membrane protein assembly factor BamB
MNFPRIFFALTTAAFALPALATDWPQYAGPEGDRSTAERVGRLPSNGPKALWRVPANGGFSSFAVSGGKAFALTVREVDGAKRETLVGHDAENGKELWAQLIEVAKYDGAANAGTDDNNGGDGPRTTPAVSGGKVYVISSKLNVACFEAASGKKVWAHDLIKEFAGRNISWQNAASPLVDDEFVFVGGGGAGQSLIAFNKDTGAVVWKQHDEKITHATPIAATILGQRQIIFFLQSGLVSVNPKDGAVLWKHTFPYKTSTAASPVVSGDIVYCSAGYGVGATAARVSKAGNAWKTDELWFSQNNRPIANHWSTPVYRDGHLYGMFSFKEYGRGPLKCVELATGKVKWEQPGFGAGQVILTGDTVLALSDKGELIQVAAQADSYKEIARAKVVTGKCWSTPTVANGKIFVRSTKEAACFDASATVARN